MSRLGVANFYRSGSTPSRNDAIWREAVVAEQRPHVSSSFYRKPQVSETRPSEMKDAFAKTWALIKNVEITKYQDYPRKNLVARERQLIRSTSEIPSFRRIIT